MEKQELIKPIVRMGNSACVLLPKAWVDGKARVELIEKPIDIKKDLFEILSPYLEDIIGIYLVGSYARGEQTFESDVDVIVITNNLKKEIVHGKYHISIYSLDSIEKTLKNNPIMIYPRLMEAVVILNKSILERLRNIKISKKQFREFIEDTKRIIKIDKEFIELDKLDGDFLESKSVIYSLVLRFRAIFLIKNILSKKIYSKKLFKQWLIKHIVGKENVEKIYSIYEGIRDEDKNKTNRVRLEISLAEKVLNLLENEVKRFEK